MNPGITTKIDNNNGNTENFSTEIKKLFDKLGKIEKELGENGIIDLNGDGHFDDKDIKTFLEGNINITNGGIIEKEIKANEKKGSLIFLQQLIKRVETRKQTKNKAESFVKGAKIVNKEKAGISETQKTTKQKELEIKSTLNDTDINAKSKDLNINSKEISDKKMSIENNKNILGGLYNKLDTNIKFIESYIDFINNNSNTYTEKTYDTLFQNFEKAIKETTDLLLKINTQLEIIKKEEKEEKKLEKKHSVISHDLTKIISKLNNTIPVGGNKEQTIGFFNSLAKIAESIKNNPFSKENLFTPITNKAKEITANLSETTKGIGEYFKNYDSIVETASLFPVHNKIADLKNKAKAIKDNPSLTKIKKWKSLKQISKDIGETAREIIISNVNSSYDDIKKTFNDKDGTIKKYYDDIIKRSNQISDHGGISTTELKNLLNYSDHLNNFGEYAKKIEKKYDASLLEGKKLESLKEKGKTYLEEIKKKYFLGEKIDLTKFTNFIDENINTKLEGKKISEMTIDEAKTALKYTNVNFKEINARSIFAGGTGDETLSELDDLSETNRFQEKLIKKIFDKQGGFKDSEVGYSNIGMLWGYNNEKGNYIIPMRDLMVQFETKSISEIDSKVIASYFIFLAKGNKNINISLLIQTLGINKLKELQQLWQNDEKTTYAKTILEKFNIKELLADIKKYNIEEYYKNITDPQKIQDTILEIDKNIGSEKNPKKKEDLINTLKGLLSNVKLTYSNYNENDFSNLNLQNQEITKIIQEKILDPIANHRKTERKDSFNKFKGNVLNVFKDKFKENSQAYSLIKKALEQNSLGDGIKGTLTFTQSLVKKAISINNKEHPENKIELNYQNMNEMIKSILEIDKYQILKSQEGFNDLMKELNNKIGNLNIKIKKIEIKKIKVTKDIKENNQQITQIKKQIEKETNNETKDELVKKQKTLENKNKELKTEAEQLEKEKLEAITNQKEIKQEKIKISIELKKLENRKNNINSSLKTVNKAIKKEQTVEDFSNSEEGIKFIQEEKKINEKLIKEYSKKLEIITNGNIEESNKLLDELIITNNKEIQKIEKEQATKTQNTEKESKDNKNIELNLEQYDFNPDTGTISTFENGEETSFQLSKEDKILVEENKDLLPKIIDFHKTLSDLGLSNLWNIKDKIFIALKTKYGVGFDLKGDYLNKNETFIFLNSILISVGEEKINAQTIEGFKAKFKQKNNLQFNGGLKDDILKKGESSIEEKFLDKFVNNYSTFQISKFLKSLSQGQKNNE